MRQLAVFLVAVFLAACRPAPSPVSVVSRANSYATVDPGVCLRIARGNLSASESLCLGFISQSLVETISTCAQVGGKLVPLQPPSLQSVDVNGDGQFEFLYDVTENFQCDGAPSVFSCGSLGCPVPLFEKRNGAWIAIGFLSTGDAAAIEVLMPEPGLRYGTLRGGCAGDRPCEEWTYYRWNGSAYQRTMIEVRGHWVDVAPDGLWTLVREVPVLASPAPDARVLERYPVDSEVVVIGDARGTPYKYVSPCNSCKNGFIDPAALRRTRPRT
jgi:hypothetical protein